MAWGSVNVPGGAVGGDVSGAYAQANAAYNQANVAYNAANNANTAASAAASKASLAHNAANNAGTAAANANAAASAAASKASSAHNQANAAFNQANTANNLANAAANTAAAVNAAITANYLALGSNAKSSGKGSTALGAGANACGDYTAAVGSNTNAPSPRATALGANATATGSSGTALGAFASANAFNATALGGYAAASGGYAVALGKNANASGNYSTALGADATVSGSSSVALGWGAVAANDNSIQLGNASSLSSITAKVSITVTSDERDKTDITEISEGATEFLKKVMPVTYVYNQRELYRPMGAELDENGIPIVKEGVEYLTEEDRENLSKYGSCRYNKELHHAGAKKGSRRRAGMLAQQVQAALAEIYGSSSYANLVNDNLFDFDNVPDEIESTLAMNYEGFIPFLIKAIQELDARVSALEGA